MGIEAGFKGRIGEMTWKLPADVEETILGESPKVQAEIIGALGDSAAVFCRALLSTFGNQSKIDVMNHILIELDELVDK